ncbi:JAB domain-containing protein [Bacillus salipaludis]|uniref:JAB domain-containing protein n=1 Tax=Bacillus salipaludis TaxID=2547811 RepID=UPI003AF327C2
MRFARQKKKGKTKNKKEREFGEMEFMSIFEVVRIKQEIKESQEPFVKYSIRSPEDAHQLAASYIADEDREVLLVLMLNSKNQVVGLHRAHIGSLNASIVHPREVMKCAILNNAASIIVSHQHPSGDPTPSREDIEITKRLAEAGKILGIEVLDHVIVTHTGKHVSLREKGHL